MTLIALSVVVITLLIAALAVLLSMIGVFLNRSADNLDDCLHNMKTIVKQAEVIGPAIERINRSGGELVGALPLLYDDAERISAMPAPNTPPKPGLGYLDE